MKALLNIKLGKKYKYAIQAVITSLFIFLVSVSNFFKFPVWGLVLMTVLLVIAGTLIVQYPNVGWSNFFFCSLMSFILISGALLSLHYFPNLGFPFKVGVVIFFGLLHYLVSLIDNVFLVIYDREEVIPLYRVAITWSLILQVVMAIPLFAGFAKINTNGFVQGALASLVSFLFGLYQIWIHGFDKDAKKAEVGEYIFLPFVVSFLVFISSITMSFIPAESFLRALFTAAVLMFGLTYITAYLKNEISKKLILQYAFIILIFLLIILTFQP